MHQPDQPQRPLQQSRREGIGKLRIAVIGAGPVGLSLALHASRALPDASITVFDSRPLGADAVRDPRTLAMSLGSIQLLQRLKAWRPESAQAITDVHVSQQAPAALGRLPDPCVRISAADEGVAQLGAVLGYGDIVAPLEAVWMAATTREPQRLVTRFGTSVISLDNLAPAEGPGVRVTFADASRHDNGGGPLGDGDGSGNATADFDIGVVAEGGVFSDQARKALQHDYRQTAWVGKVSLEAGEPGMAFERFTRFGPAALLPLPQLGAPVSQGIGFGDVGTAGLATALVLATTKARRAALVWCVPTDDDPVRGLDDEQRVAVLNATFHKDTGRITAIGPLKSFALGLNAERTLTDGRIVRIGNAAQTLHPVAGQGLNLGMRDSFELVRRLSTAASIDAALRGVEWSRAPDRWAMIAATDFLARSFTWQLPGLSAVRGIALAGLQVATPLKSFIARQMMFGRR